MHWAFPKQIIEYLHLLRSPNQSLWLDKLACWCNHIQASILEAINTNVGTESSFSMLLYSGLLCRMRWKQSSCNAACPQIAKLQTLWRRASHIIRIQISSPTKLYAFGGNHLARGAELCLSQTVVIPRLLRYHRHPGSYLHVIFWRTVNEPR